MNFYEELKDYAKFILGKIEENNSKVTVNFRSDKVTIEHIMPQKLSKEWKKELGANWEEVHKKYLHNIGNLILTEFNEEMGNKSFAEKKKRLMASNLSYRLSIINEDTWNEESIIRHRDRMIKWFLETFPLPDEYKHNNNMIEDAPDSYWKDYRTLDGKTYQEVDSLDSETLFVNVRMSAQKCLRRISNVMEKFNMDGDEVKIRIKSAEGKKELANLF